MIELVGVLATYSITIKELKYFLASLQMTDDSKWVNIFVRFSWIDLFFQPFNMCTLSTNNLILERFQNICRVTDAVTPIVWEKMTFSLTMIRLKNVSTETILLSPNIVSATDPKFTVMQISPFLALSVFDFMMIKKFENLHQSLRL